MTSLRKKVTSYFRQLSFHNEPRERKSNINENSFITKYLTGQIKLKDGPPVLYGKSPNDLPNFELGTYTTGSDNIVGCSTGPNGGLTTVTRIEKHLSITDPDIDFIDTQEELAETKHKSPIRTANQPLDNTTMVIKVAGQEYKVTNRKSRSLGSLTDLTALVDNQEELSTCSNLVNSNLNSASNGEPPKTVPENNNEFSEQCKNNQKQIPLRQPSAKNCDDILFSNTQQLETDKNQSEHVNRNFSLSKSKSECNPFEHRKKGKIIRLTERPQAQGALDAGSTNRFTDSGDPMLPKQWNRKTDFVYGLSDSLYDTNQVTKNKNGNPIADCYGVIAREDSAILALADGVNWGEKACIAAKSAIHGCLHYLNKTIFDDTSLFEFDNSKSEIPPQFYDNQNSPINTSYISPPKPQSTSSKPSKTSDTNENRIVNTTDVFVSLLRAFNCAHNLILENQGMLTTLTVAVVLPLKSSSSRRKSSDISTQDLNLPRRRAPLVTSSSTHPSKPRANSTASIISDTSVIKYDDFKGEKYICCVCNVGDTLAYVYSPKYGVRELTKGSHDVYLNRDMRDALGALGPVDGINPELNNLTLSVTTLDAGDIVMIASDGLTDNYDPTVCKYTVNSTTSENPKAQRTNPGSHASKEMPSVKPTITPSTRDPSKPIRERRISSSGTKSTPSKVTPSNVSRLALTQPTPSSSSSTSSSGFKSDITHTNKENNPEKLSYDICDNPLVAQFMSENAFENKEHEPYRPKSVSSQKHSKPTQKHTNLALKPPKRVALSSSENKNKHFNPLAKSTSVSGVFKSKTSSNVSEPVRYNFLRSKTSIDLAPPVKIIPRNDEGLPFVTPIQKYELTLLLIEDILKRGISGKETQCSNAKTLCENLLKYTVSITAAKRHTLEDVDLYFDNKNDILVECSLREKKVRRKRCLEKVQNLPGKLDHVSVVAYNVGNKIVEFSNYS